MGTHYIPRNVKGEGRILMIFSTKALIYTAISAVFGIIIFFIAKSFGATTVGLVILGIFCLIGFALGTLKMPDSTAFSITRKTGGENIDVVILRAIKFKAKKQKLYVNTLKEDTHE